MSFDAHAAWIVDASLRVAVAGLAAWLLDGLLRRRAWPSLLAALWWIVLLVPLVPLPLVVRARTAVADLSPGTWLGDSLLARESLLDEVVGATPTWALWIVAVWVVGLAVLALLFAWREHRALRAWRRELAPLRDEALIGRAATLAASVGLRRVPRLAYGPRAAVIGVLRPTVSLPRSLMAGSNEAIDHVLLHEFAHVARLDPLKTLGSVALQLLFWFHPVAWFARRRLADLREIGCDARVAKTLGDRRPEYRDTLLELARPMLATPAGGLGFVHPSQLLMRIVWLDRGPTRLAAPLRHFASLCLATLLIVCCVPWTVRDPLRRLGLPSWDELEGCLNKRFAIQRLLAEQDRATDPDESRSGDRSETRDSGRARGATQLVPHDRDPTRSR